MKNEWLRGKTVIVAGAGNGVGKQLSYDLIKQYSCRVIGVDMDEIALSNLKTKINEEGEEFDYFAFDAKQEANWIELARVVNEKKIQIDVLINGIGQVPKFNHFDKYTHKDMLNTMSINLYSCIFAIKALKSNMEKSRTPSIINLCCSTAVMGLEGTSIYSASKSALKCYTEVLQNEMKDFYVGLFTLGLIQTDFWAKQNETTKSKIKLRAMSPSTASKKIIKNINAKKKRVFVGFDAHIVDRLLRLMPHNAQRFFNYYIKKKKYRLIDEQESKW